MSTVNSFQHSDPKRIYTIIALFIVHIYSLYTLLLVYTSGFDAPSRIMILVVEKLHLCGVPAGEDYKADKSFVGWIDISDDDTCRLERHTTSILVGLSEYG